MLSGTRQGRKVSSLMPCYPKFIPTVATWRSIARVKRFIRITPLTEKIKLAFLVFFHRGHFFCILNGHPFFPHYFSIAMAEGLTKY